MCKEFQEHCVRQGITPNAYYKFTCMVLGIGVICSIVCVALSALV